MKAWSYFRCALLTTLAPALVAGCGGAQLPSVATASTPNDAPTRRATSSYQVIYNFQGGNDGIFPAGWAAPLTVVNGELYGTTEGGGGGYCSCGTVFQTSASGSESVIYAFKGSQDGAVPDGNVIRFKGEWYGTTNQGGANDLGVVFAITASGQEQIIHSFGGSRNGDGAWPYGNLVAFRGALYGTTSIGGSSDNGTVFKVTRSGKVKILYSFTGFDGAHPWAGLIALDGRLYGTTTSGGRGDCGSPYSGCGTVYSISTLGAEKLIYSFTGGNDGAVPEAPLTAIGHDLYGTTWRGGGQGYLGTAFKVNRAGKLRVLHRFSEYTDGYNPTSTLFNLNGTLYGTTSLGGNGGVGVVFSLTKSGTESILHSFGALPDGQFPTGGLTAIGNTLYGTTSAGGTGQCSYPTGCGTIFTLTP